MEKKYDSSFKAKVALEAIKDEKTVAEIASEYQVHPARVREWRRKMLDKMPEIFKDKKDKEHQDNQKVQEELYKQIGQLKVELEWLKKKSKLVK